MGFTAFGSVMQTESHNFLLLMTTSERKIAEGAAVGNARAVDDAVTAVAIQPEDGQKLVQSVHDFPK